MFSGLPLGLFRPASRSRLLAVPAQTNEIMAEPIAHTGTYALVSLCATLLLCPAPAEAIPSFARQTGQPCATCHVGAFGPQLTQFGREFKMNGFVWNDGKSHVPLAGMLQASFTHTSADQAGGAAPGFAPNDNPAIDQVSLFYGGQVFDKVGAFAQLTYDGIAKQLHWDNLDL